MWFHMNGIVLDVKNMVTGAQNLVKVYIYFSTSLDHLSHFCYH